MITQTLKLNLIPGQVLPRVNVSQYDAGTRTLQMLLYNGDQTFNISSGMSGFVQGTKPDRRGFQYPATVTQGSNVVTLVITQQMTAVSGEVTCELVIASGDDRIATVNFILYVEPAALADDTVISETELPDIITQATEQMERAEAAAATATTKASEASTSATNAASSATSAASSATSAGNSATSAANSAASAEESADRAQSYSVNTPYIGANGNWWVWNTTQGAYVDTGVDASITVDIEDITMLAPDATPYVTNTGTDTDPVFHLFIPRGKGISGINKTSTSGLVDTYTITYSDGATTTFTVSNGRGINTISKTSTSGLVDTYTIAYNDNTTSTFTVTNGKTAYQSAVEGGYSGTEAEFEADLAHFEEWKDDAETAANNAADSELVATQAASDAANSASLAEQYADFVTPHFIIENNRLYIKDDAVGEFVVANNRLYIKLAS